MKINDELQKVKTQDLVHNWKENYRASQQQLRRKHLVKGKGSVRCIEQLELIELDYVYVKTIPKLLFKLHLVLILIIFLL